jgi:hypothetical protein
MAVHVIMQLELELFTPVSDNYTTKFLSNSQTRAINKYKNLKYKVLKWNANIYSNSV